MVASSSRPSCLVSNTVSVILTEANAAAASCSVDCWLAGIFLPYRREDWRRCAHIATMQLPSMQCSQATFTSHCKTLGQLPEPDKARAPAQGSSARTCCAPCCSLTWWAMWTHWWGGVCFFMIGVCLYWYSPTKQDLGIVVSQAWSCRAC